MNTVKTSKKISWSVIFILVCLCFFLKDNTSLIQLLDRKIDINNIFTQNRLSLEDSVEGGQSLTLGGEYTLQGKESGKDIVKAGIATVLRNDEEINLPTKSTLNNKGSDLIGSLIFEPNKNLKFDMSRGKDIFGNNKLLKSLGINKFKSIKKTLLSYK